MKRGDAKKKTQPGIRGDETAVHLLTRCTRSVGSMCGSNVPVVISSASEP